eukprot:c19185_g1_i1 orf=286-1263(+)
MDIRLAVSGIMTRVCFGDEFATHTKIQDPEKALQLQGCLEAILEMTSVVQLGDYIPLARALPSSRAYYKRYNEIKERIKEFLLPAIATRRKQLQGHQQSHQSFMDILLSVEDEEDRLTDIEILWNLVELMVGGTDTISITLEWALALLVAFPHKQQQAYNEIRQETPQDSEFIPEERLDNLPYLQSIIKETLRKTGPTVLSIPHATTKDCKLMGYDIPRQTQVLINQYAVLNDPKLWGDPEVFRPERFSDEDLKQTSYTAFGAGRRICPGMNMAKIQLHLILANLLWAFRWCPPRSEEAVDLTGRLQFVYSLKTPFKARIVDRQS